MNIFVTDQNPKICAMSLCDKHAVKMILESGQMLSTAHRLCNGSTDVYKTAYQNHPCTIWTRQTDANYMWHLELFVHMCAEYQYRYKKIHTTYSKLINQLLTIPSGIPNGELTPFPCCMPDEYKISSNVFHNYRWFICNKPFPRVWTKRSPPFWFVDHTNQLLK